MKHWTARLAGSANRGRGERTGLLAFSVSEQVGEIAALERRR
jgi:hypothetical protein